MSTAILHANTDEMRRALAVLTNEDQVVELRSLKVVTPQYRKPHTVAGYFDRAHLDSLVTAAAQVNPTARGVYITGNPLVPALLARASNRTVDVGEGDATSDKDVVARRWLYLDVDPERPANICATADEREAARQVALAVHHYLCKVCGWPAPISCDSGNGYYLLWRIDMPAADGGIVQRCLLALAAMFDTPAALIDTSMYNPARIIRLPGTVNRKGDNTADRPHRLSRLIHVPSPITVVSRVQLEVLAGTLPPEPERSSSAAGSRFDLAAFIALHNLDVGPARAWQGGTRYVFNTCPWDSAHSNRYRVRRAVR